MLITFYPPPGNGSKIWFPLPLQAESPSTRGTKMEASFQHAALKDIYPLNAPLLVDRAGSSPRGRPPKTGEKRGIDKIKKNVLYCCS